jgi:hypothetical protein
MNKHITIILTIAVIFLGLSFNAEAVVYDHFTDESVSSSLWTVNDPDDISNYNATAPGYVNINSGARNQEFVATSNTAFTGDFDVQLNWLNYAASVAAGSYDDNDEGPSIGIAIMSLSAFNTWMADPSQEPNSYMKIARETDVETNNGYYISDALHMGSRIDNEAPTADVAGLLKISRTDDDFVASYFSSGIWYDLLTASDVHTEPVIIAMRAYSGDGDLNSNFVADVDYVDVCSEGTQEIPEPATMVLLGSLATGLFSVAGIRKRSRR